MASVMHVHDHNVASCDVLGDCAVADEASKFYSEWVDRRPNEEISADVSAVALEPSVQSRGSLSACNCGKCHGGRTHQAASLADSVGRSSELLVGPLGVTLLVKRVIPGSDDSDQRNKDDNIFA